MELLLIRHGAVPGNLRGEYIGSTDQPLAPEGVAQAQARQGDMPPVDKLWVSPMLRCVQTAELLFPAMGQIPVADLRECDFGDFEQRTWEELKDDPAYQRFLSGDPGAAFPNGESVECFLERSRQGITQVVEQARELGITRAAIVAHGGTIMAAMSAFTRPSRGFYDWQVRNCGGYLVSVEGNPFVFKLLEEL